MSILDINQLEDFITNDELKNIREFMINSKWNNKMPGGFVTNFPQRLVNTYGNGMKINSEGNLYGNKWNKTYWTAKQTQNNVSLETQTEEIPECLRKIIPKIRVYVKNKYKDSLIDDNSFCVAVCNNYTDGDMTITAHKDDQEWYPKTINNRPIFISLTFYPEGKPIKNEYYSRFQIKNDNDKWEDIKLEDNSMMLMSADTYHRVLKHKKKDLKYFKPRINITLRCLYDIKKNPLMNYLSIANHSRYYRNPIKLISNIEEDKIIDMLEKYNNFCIINNYERITYEKKNDRIEKKIIVEKYKKYIKKYKLMDVKFKCNIVIEALEDICKYIKKHKNEFT